MPRPNNNSYSNDRNNNRSNRSNGGYSQRKKQKDTRATKFSKSNYNMLNFGMAFLDETPGNAYEFKARVTLKRKDGELMDVADGDGKGDNLYSPQESAELIAKALLEGRAINICFFANDDGSWQGNARIDINDLAVNEVEDDAPAKKKAKAAKPKYEAPEEDDDSDDDITEVDDDSEIPY